MHQYFIINSERKENENIPYELISTHCAKSACGADEYYKVIYGPAFLHHFA